MPDGKGARQQVTGIAREFPALFREKEISRDHEGWIGEIKSPDGELQKSYTVPRHVHMKTVNFLAVVSR